LHLLSTTAAALLSSLPLSRPPNLPLPLSDLHSDLLSLLTLVYNNSTKLTLALNPPGLDPSYSAALEPLHDLTKYISTLVSNATSFDPNFHGSALTAEVRSVVDDVVRAVQELAQAHFSFVTHGGNLIGKGKGQDRLLKTAAVHELIDQARTPGDGGISDCNINAVIRRWKEFGGILNDAVNELGDDDSLDGDGQEDEHDSEDEWDKELGFNVSSEHNPAEYKFKKELHPLVVRISSFYDMIVDMLLKEKPPSNAALDHLLDTASPLTQAVDDMVSCVYDGPDQVSDHKRILVDSLLKIGKAVDALYGDEPFADLQTVDSHKGSVKGSRRWFACELQILVDGIGALEFVE